MRGSRSGRAGARTGLESASGAGRGDAPRAAGEGTASGQSAGRDTAGSRSWREAARSRPRSAGTRSGAGRRARSAHALRPRPQPDRGACRTCRRRGAPDDPGRRGRGRSSRTSADSPGTASGRGSSSAAGTLPSPHAGREGTVRLVRVLFSVQRAGFLKNFDSVVGLLAERGHEVRIAIVQPAATVAGQEALLAELAALPGVLVEPMPPLRHEYGREAARGLRGVLDYFTFLDPRYPD